MGWGCGETTSHHTLHKICTGSSDGFTTIWLGVKEVWGISVQLWEPSVRNPDPFLSLLLPPRSHCPRSPSHLLSVFFYLTPLLTVSHLSLLLHPKISLHAAVFFAAQMLRGPLRFSSIATVAKMMIEYSYLLICQKWLNTWETEPVSWRRRLMLNEGSWTQLKVQIQVEAETLWNVLLCVFDFEHLGTNSSVNKQLTNINRCWCFHKVTSCGSQAETTLVQLIHLLVVLLAQMDRRGKSRSGGSWTL